MKPIVVYTLSLVARADVGTVCNILKPTAPATNGDIRAEFGIPGVVTICSNSN